MDILHVQALSCQDELKTQRVHRRPGHLPILIGVASSEGLFWVGILLKPFANLAHLEFSFLQQKLVRKKVFTVRHDYRVSCSFLPFIVTVGYKMVLLHF